MASAGARAMLCLAAAVSDFYVPESEMPEHKIQSAPKRPRVAEGGASSADEAGLTLHLHPVTKVLGAIKAGNTGSNGRPEAAWAPQAFVVSFKLETNEAILLGKASAAIAKYHVDMVCANLLQSYKQKVTLVTAVYGDRPPEVRAPIHGDETSEVPVDGVETTPLTLDCAPAGTEMESLLVAELIARHGNKIG